MTRKDKSRKVINNVILVILSISLPFICGEIIFRIILYVKYNTSALAVSIDDKLGWRPTGNIVRYREALDAGGKKYTVKYSTNKDGFRVFGNQKTESSKKVLFIGDSFTLAKDVSNNKTYYGILKNSLPIEVFAYGGGGYGTLQEYMIIDEYIDQIRPDSIVLQFSSNDFINNHYELEKRSFINNNCMRRPYMTKEGRIVHLLPKGFRIIREIAYKHLYFTHFLISRIDRLYSTHMQQNSVEQLIYKQAEKLPQFADAVMITDLIVKKIKSRVPIYTKIYSFEVSGEEPYYREIKNISRRNEIEFIDGIPQAIKTAEQNGTIVRASDRAHWNEMGHKIASNVLKEFFAN